MRRPLGLLVGLIASSASAGDLSPLEATIVRDATAAGRRQVAGGLHCARKLPGTFADHSSAALAMLAHVKSTLLKDASAEDNYGFRDAAHGIPGAKLSPAYVELTKVGQEPALYARRALCAEVGLPAPHLTLYGMWGFGPEPDGWFDLHTALRIGAAEAWTQPESERAGRLVQSCLEFLAASHLASPHAMVGRMLSAMFVTQAVPVCEAAINHGSEADLRRLSQLTRTFAVRPPLSETLKDERVFGQLAFFSDSYSSDAREALPPDSARLFGWGTSPENQSGERPFAADARRFLFGGWARRQHFEQMQRMIDAAKLPAEMAARQIEGIDQESPLVMSLVGLRKFDDSEVRSGFAGFLRRDAEAAALLQMLLVAAEFRLHRLTAGAWPASLAELKEQYDPSQLGSLELKVENGKRVLWLSRPALPENPPPALRLE